MSKNLFIEDFMIYLFIFSTKIYNQMRLMLLGSEQTGKTSLLQAFKRESFLHNNNNNTQQLQRKVGANRQIE